MAEALAIQAEYISFEQREQQKRYDLNTQFAELVDGNMRTNFELQLVGNDLIGEDGRSLRVITDKALAEVQAMAKLNPRLWFEVRRRGLEKDEIDEAVAMARGEGPNTMVIESDFPSELENTPEDVGGYNVRRKQTMQRVLIRKPDGNIQMYSQSLDGSNREALEAIYACFGKTPEPGELLGQRIRIDLPWEEQTNLIDELTGIYDRSLTDQFGGEWYAGRRPVDYRNTYDFVQVQHDLINECIRLDNLGWLNEETMYKIAATMQQRFNHYNYQTPTTTAGLPAPDMSILYREIERAGRQASQMGMSFSACGMTLRAGGFDSSTENQLELAGYGNKPEEDEYGSLTFKCQKGHTNKRPRGKLIDNCTTCGKSVRC